MIKGWRPSSVTRLTNLTGLHRCRSLPALMFNHRTAARTSTSPFCAGILLTTLKKKQQPWSDSLTLQCRPRKATKGRHRGALVLVAPPFVTRVCLSTWLMSYYERRAEPFVRRRSAHQCARVAFIIFPFDLDRVGWQLHCKRGLTRTRLRQMAWAIRGTC